MLFSGALAALVARERVKIEFFVTSQQPERKS
jgi:hypothetical protein